MYHIQIVGAGYTGLALARFFRSKKQKVWALSRSSKHHAEFQSLEITPITADLNRAETLSKIPPAHFIVLCPAPDERSDAAYRSVYLEGISNYLQAIRKNPRPNLIVYLSSTAVYGERGGAWVDETTPLRPETEKQKILIEAETQVLESGYPAAVFRLGGIYGPGRNSLAKLEEKCAQTPDAYTNMIHVDDIAGAMPVLFNKGQEGNVYLGVDDEPVKRSEFHAWLTSKLGKTPLQTFSSQAGGKRCRNTKLKSLDYKFQYPTFREGYLDLIDQAKRKEHSA